MQGNCLYPISVNLQWRSMSFYICFSLSVTAHRGRGIFGMIFESLVYCVTGFPSWETSLQCTWLYTKVLWFTSALGIWPALHPCTRSNILINSVQKWLPYMIFLIPKWSDWDIMIAPFLHFLLSEVWNEYPRSWSFCSEVHNLWAQNLKKLTQNCRTLFSSEWNFETFSWIFWSLP